MNFQSQIQIWQKKLFVWYDNQWSYHYIFLHICSNARVNSLEHSKNIFPSNWLLKRKIWQNIAQVKCQLCFSEPAIDVTYIIIEITCIFIDIYHMDTPLAIVGQA